MSDPETTPRYRIEEFIGSGGTGQVYRAWDEVLRRSVALKLLRERRADSLDGALREARAQAQVSHPNLCKVFDVGRQDGKAYVASELIAGPSLGDVAPLRVERALAVVRDVALAVHACHDQGLVHRDLKPQNVLLEEAESGADQPLVPRVVDFGISQLETDSAEVAVGETTTGTPAFMAPEQIRGGPQAVDPAVDIYALGGLLHYLLIGEPPFDAEDPIELLKQVLQQDPPRMQDLRADLPRELDAIASCCLEKVASRRYPSALAVAEDLERALTDRPVSVMPHDRRYVLSKFLRRNRVAVFAASVLACATLLFGMVTLQGRARSQREAQLARDFGAQAEQLGARMQLAHLSGTDDLTKVRSSVENGMQLLSERALRLGTIGLGPGESALGFANLRMGRVAEAAQHFERAWEAGFERPEVSLGLAEAMARQYAGEQRTLYHLSTTVQRLRQEQLRRTLLVPALERLQVGLAELDSAGRTDTAYLEALRAFLEDRHADLKGLVAQAIEQEPFRYEARMLEGYSARSQSILRDLDGEHEAVRPLLEEAERAFQIAADVARSDPLVFQELCITKEALVYQSLRDSVDDPEELSPACQRGISLAPQDPGPQRARAGLLQRLALTKARRGEAFEEQLAAAREHLEHALPLAPEQASLHLLMATQHSMELNMVSWHDGSNRLPAAEAAVEHAERAQALDLESVWAPFVLGQTHFALARVQADVGIDPSPVVAAARQHFERAIDLAPDVGRTYASYGNLLDWFAEMQSGSLGQDPKPSSDAAKAALAKAIELEPRNIVPHSVLSVAHMTMASHLQRTGRDPREEVLAGSAAIERVLELRSQSVNAFSNLSEIWLVAVDFELVEGTPEEAYENHRAALEQAVALDPDEFGCSLAKSDWYQARIDVLRARSPLVAINRGLATTSEMLSRFEDSRTCMRDRARLLLEMARYERSNARHTRCREGALSEGRDFIGRLIERNPKDRQAWYLRAEYALFAAQSDHDEEAILSKYANEALEAFNETLVLSPGCALCEVGQRESRRLLGLGRGV